ncbi:HD domain-containing phosphohydrolase [Holophaga foetida]|uniref:HD domain-containing phosphohydrolase n=1 Tax=Holophaga foetida TaxID=35839 RepID=UPI000698AB9D|nr:HD domain-containing phosphohydrolase [Holophaga foetida]
MRLTVVIPLQYRSSLEGHLGRELRQILHWIPEAPADVVVGSPGEGRLAQCTAWPGEAGALALLEAGYQRLRDQRDMERLHEIGRALASEHNLDRLLDLILIQARRLLDAEGGSIYLVVSGGGGRELLFAHTQNSRISLPFHRYRMPISTQSMAGFVATTGECLNIPDVYEIPVEAPYHFNDSFDCQAGYRSTSMLVVPLQDTEGEVLGVLQLINRVEEDGEIVPFLSQHVRLAQSLAGQAGVAVKNASLREDIERLFEGFVNASVLAIEQRDPVTSGHSGRVAALTVGLAEAINATPDGPFGELCFNERQLRELRYASLLHDFGKVGVREQVLVKSKKLDPGRLELLLHRLRQRQEERMLETLKAEWAAGRAFRKAFWEETLRSFQAETDRLVSLVQRSNEPTVLPQEVADLLGTLGGLQYTHWNGAVEPIFQPQDLACLAIPKGSLSEEERLEIESHVTHTFRFLQQIPWTRDLSDVPEIAYAHHERLNGRGYPRQITAPEIPIQSRAMSIADVFDALTAQDRPYKAAVPLDRSLAILELDAVAGHLDKDLLKLFVDAKVYERTVRRY